MITVGIDEVGRGCWAGPLVAGAVILPTDFALSKGIVLRDSKKLSKAQRDRTAAYIRLHALAVGLGWVWPDEIDALGLSACVSIAMERALREINIPYDEVIIDGNINYIPYDARTRAVIRADDSVSAVSAASITAKVARDVYMAEQALRYPGYGFERHVGYGTKDHASALRRLGVSEIHRLSYKPIQAFLI